MVFSYLLSTPGGLAPRPAPAACYYSYSSAPCRARLVAVGRGGRLRCQAQGGARDVDGHYIRRCVELARTAAGHTSPNPMVGCVIVRDGRVVGEGFHPKAGQPHAEVITPPNTSRLYTIFFLLIVWNCERIVALLFRITP